MSNYGNDRLALYMFEATIRFLQCWTNLQFQSIPALQLADKYFRMYPEENEPIWGVKTRISFIYFSFISLLTDIFFLKCVYLNFISFHLT